MERDFMGLSVKQEIHDDDEPPIDAAPVRSLAMQWSFSNKASAVPQLVSFPGSRDDKPKMGFDSLASTGLVTITTTENFHSDPKSYQKTIVPEKQGGIRYTIHQQTTAKPKLTVLPAIGGAVHQSFVAATRQNMIGNSTLNPLAGVPFTNHVPAVPSTGPVVGTTDLRNGPTKCSGSPAQLTLFYNGSVCVYDNISADKAQAIMLLAGNGPSTTSIATPTPATPVFQASMPSKPPSVLESFAVSHPYTTIPRHPGPTLVTSISGSQYAGRSITNNDASIVKPGGVIISSNQAEPRSINNMPGFTSSTFIPSSTVPQFRRKSLARFLEKRKERVINTTPYTKQQSPDRSIPASGSTSLSVNSSC